MNVSCVCDSWSCWGGSAGHVDVLGAWGGGDHPQPCPQGEINTAGWPSSQSRAAPQQLSGSGEEQWSAVTPLPRARDTPGALPSITSPCHH